MYQSRTQAFGVSGLGETMKFSDLPVGVDGRAHLAIFVEPYLGLLLEGKKTIESRWSRHGIAPYGRIAKGDLVYVKKSGGPVVASFVVRHYASYHLDGLSAEKDRETIRGLQWELCVNETFLAEQFRIKTLCTLIWVSQLTRLPKPLSIESCGRAGWHTRTA